MMTCNEREAFETGLSFSGLSPDFETMMVQLHEFATDIHPNGTFRFPLLPYRVRATAAETVIDRLHLEVLPANYEYVDVELNAYVEANPKRQELAKFGIDEPRDLIVRIALPVLESVGLVIQKPKMRVVGGVLTPVSPATTDHGPLHFVCDQGDLLYFQGQFYDVLSLHQDQFWGNTEIPAWVVLACSVARDDTTTNEDLDDTNDEWRDDPLNPEDE